MNCGRIPCVTHVMPTRDDTKHAATKSLAWLLMLGALTLFSNAIRLQHRPPATNAVAHQFTEPNPVFVQAYQAALSSAE
jgi:hypothetical protein